MACQPHRRSPSNLTAISSMRRRQNLNLRRENFRFRNHFTDHQKKSGFYIVVNSFSPIPTGSSTTTAASAETATSSVGA
jgi:hypothetical protein